eukprot:TRINITY_DN2728_c0_g1_i1.p1 TRINITY_DN2728_c0_g1~~TRINITY_DN2728_c0_g1_i1.p1  ORF type:complete len:162 (-),score=50.05 TRINITY_DN2728_c0_g1_i1:165-650(-)
MIETIFDTLNAKAAILLSVLSVFEELNVKLPVFISGTIVDQSGRTLSGQTTEAILLQYCALLTICSRLTVSLGAKDMVPFLSRLSNVAECFVLAYPNAGLPNEMGEYDQPPHDFAKEVSLFADSSLINLVGGCCGTSTEYIHSLAECMESYKPRILKNSHA